MKIGLVLSKPPAYSETFFNSKIKGLQKNGFTVVLFVQKKDKLFTLCKTKTAPKVYNRNFLLQISSTIWVFFKLAFFSKRIFRFIELERQSKRSWIQVFKNLYNNSHILTSKLDWLHFGFGTMALQSEHVAKAIKAKMAVSFRGFDIAIYPISHPSIYHVLWENVDKVHAISHDLLTLAYQDGMKKETAFQIINPAINVNTFTVIDTINKKNTDKLQLVTIARLHWKKGIIDTLEALAIIKKQGVTFHYTVIGEGQDYEQIVFAVYQLKLEENVTFIGKINHEDVVLQLEKANVYLQYSISEGFCNAVLEAQSMGLLCVVSDAEGLPENVLHNQTGWVVPKRNPEALAKKIIDVIHLPEAEKYKISRQAQQRVKTQFNLEKQDAAFIKFYE